MRIRTLALALAISFALTTGAEARKKGSHSTPPTVQSMKKGRKYRPNVKGRRVKPRKVARRKVNR